MKVAILICRPILTLSTLRDRIGGSRCGAAAILLGDCRAAGLAPLRDDGARRRVTRRRGLEPKGQALLASRTAAADPAVRALKAWATALTRLTACLAALRTGVIGA